MTPYEDLPHINMDEHCEWYLAIVQVVQWLLSRLRIICRAFPIPSGAPCTLASLFTSIKHCLEMLFHYLVTLSYKPVQYSLHSWMIFSNLRFTIDDFTVYSQVNVFTTTCDSLSESKPEPHHTTRHTVLSLIIILATGSKVRGFKPSRHSWIFFRT